MWVIVFLAGCSTGSTASVRWSFADHRTCAEANVVTVVVRDGARELARIACEQGVVEVDGVETDVLVAEAVGYHGTVLYRARFRPREVARDIVLRYVGGSDE